MASLIEGKERSLCAVERHFSSGNTAAPVTRPHALSSVIIHK